MNKAASSRRNGAKSKGPVTPEGKARSAQNSFKHGLNSRVVVLANESQAEYDDLFADYMRQYRPVGLVELDLLHEIAATRWRQRRCLRLETAAFDQAMEQNPDSVLDGTFGKNGPMLQLNRYESRLRRAYERATAELRRLQAERKAAEKAEEKPVIEKQPNEPKGYFETYLDAVVKTSTVHPIRIAKENNNP